MSYVIQDKFPGGEIREYFYLGNPTGGETQWRPARRYATVQGVPGSAPRYYRAYPPIETKVNAQVPTIPVGQSIWGWFLPLLSEGERSA